MFNPWEHWEPPPVYASISDRINQAFQHAFSTQPFYTLIKRSDSTLILSFTSFSIMSETRTEKKTKAGRKFGKKDDRKMDKMTKKNEDLRKTEREKERNRIFGIALLVVKMDG